MSNKKRVIGLDILRIISVLIVCAFHTRIHLGANYGVFNSYVSMGAVYMTLFFMLSGYSLFFAYSDKDFNDWNELKAFYKKRIKGIVPMYYIVGLLYIVGVSMKSGGDYKKLYYFQ